jgi:uncharacterized protein
MSPKVPVVQAQPKKVPVRSDRTGDSGSAAGGPDPIARVVAETGLKPEQVRAAAQLLEQGCTIPFIARYRKEITDSLDEVALTTVRDRLEQLRELEERRAAILRSLEERGLLTEELKASLEGAPTKTRLEDLYLPLRPKRRTRAAVAREKGLEPLAERLFEAALGTGAFAGPDGARRAAALDPGAEAVPFVDPGRGVGDATEALQGARDILAERFAEEPEVRGDLRNLFERRGALRSRVAKGKEEEGAKYRDYFDWQERADDAPSHRILALLRGEREGMLSLSIFPPEEEALRILERRFVRTGGPAADQARDALEDGYRRLAAPSLETEYRAALKERADLEAIGVFARNVRDLLMEPPLGRKAVLAVDPGVRTGCKLTLLGSQGDLMATGVIQIARSDREREEAARTVLRLVGAHPVEAVAVGNGTGGREAEAFLRGLALPGKPVLVRVSESGASIYSASETARKEFPDLDLTLRGAASIGRRLQDPLAELVKIDPKSIGVGQYQHDVDQKDLKRALDDVVVSCVNRVGVEVNTASPQLLAYVSGLGPVLAENIRAYREEKGPFRSRAELKKVPRLGPKAFEQAAGFLRIRDGENPLDAGAVHPEHYGIVREMAKDLGCSLAELLADPALRKRIEPERYVRPGVGLPTLGDILAELDKPGRDPREHFEAPAFSPEVRELSDLKPGMVLEGMVTNVAAFGAFVDLGVHVDGLVHVSRLADRFVKDPTEVVRTGRRVRVVVLEVDLARKRISLSMRPSDGAKV